MLPRISLTHDLAHLRSTLSTKPALKSRTCNGETAPPLHAGLCILHVIMVEGRGGWSGQRKGDPLKRRALASAGSSLDEELCRR